MSAISLATHSGKLEHVLCFGAHCDDIEIGCGGTILTLLETCDNLEVTWVLFTSSEKRREEAERGASAFCEKAAKLNLKIFDFRDGFLPWSGAEVKDAMEQVKREINAPDLVLTHYHKDMHQDHRFIAELTWNTFRNHLILEYEIPKWDGDLGTPNTYLPLSKNTGREKIRLLQEVYNSQQTKKWFTDDLFWSLMRLRGMECNAPDNIAEAFYGRKNKIVLT